MARATFGGTAGDFVATVGPGRVVRTGPATLTIWSAATGGTQYTDLLLDGSPVTTITVGSDGQVPEFQGPDGVLTVWADAGAGRIRLISDDSVIAGMAAAAAATAEAAQAAAEAAAAEAELISGLTGEDSAVATILANPASDSRTTLDGLIEPVSASVAAEQARAQAAEAALQADIDAWSTFGVLKGDWSATPGDYAAGDIVNHAGSIWGAKAVAVAADEPGVSAIWQELPATVDATARTEAATARADLADLATATDVPTIVRTTDPGIPSTDADFDDEYVSVEVDDVGHISRAVLPDGTQWLPRVKIGEGTTTSAVEYDGVLWAPYVDADDHLPELVLDKYGRVPAWALAQWKARGGFGAEDTLTDLVGIATLLQSNSTQADTALDLFAKTDPRLLKWTGSEIIEVPVSETYVLPNTARELLRELPAHVGVLIVPCGVGATSFRTTAISPAPPGYTTTTGTWDRTRHDAGEVNLYDAAVAKCIAAEAAAVAAGYAFSWYGAIVSGGEGDTPYLDESAYGTQLDDMLTAFRTAISEPNLFYAVSSMVPEYVALNGQAHTQGVARALADTPNRLTRTAFVWGPENATQDDTPIHWSTEGNYYRGPLMLAGFRRARNNLTTTKPSTVQGLAVRRSGTTVTATWLPPITRVTTYTAEFSVNDGGSWSAMTLDETSNQKATCTVATATTPVLVRVTVANEVGTGAPAQIAA